MPAADHMIDRINLKKQLNRWRFGVFGGLILAVILLTETGAGTKVANMEPPFIARITVDGFVQDDPIRNEALEEALTSKHIRALIVAIDTPGGAVVGGEETFHRLREIAAQKPVVAVMRGMATSAGYMIAIGGDYIVAREGTLTGSIGVLLETAEFTELASKLGITPITIKSAPLKASPGMFEKSTPEAEAALQSVIDDTYAMFKEMVASRRGLSAEEMAVVADGRVFTGRQAKTLKLVDELGGEGAAKAWLTEKKGIDADLEIKDIDNKINDLDALKEYLNSSVRGLFGLISPASGLDGMVAIWHPSMGIQ